jgi:hypothetical protein
MNQIDRSTYSVAAGEVVTIELIATLVGEFASLVFDGAAQVPSGTGPITYNFTVSVPPGGTHFGVVTCSFPKAAPDDAHFQVRLRATGGSGPSGPFDGSDVYKTDAVWTRPLQLRRF